MKGCEHRNVQVDLAFATFTDGDGGPVVGHNAEIRLACGDCGEPFTWLGPCGSSPSQPMVSLDGLTLRAPVLPASAGRAMINDLERAAGRAGPGEA